MRLKKVLIILLIPLAADLLVACCDCEEPQLFKYTNSNLELQNLDNRGQAPVIANNGIALKEAFGIRMTVKCEATASVQPKVSFFINRSYAFSCGCDPAIQYLAKDSVVALRIITLEDFDPQHLAGADVSAYFKLYTRNNFTGINEYLERNATVFYYDEAKNINLDALLMKAPTANGTFTFRVEMELSDGRSFAKESSTIELL